MKKIVSLISFFSLIAHLSFSQIGNLDLEGELRLGFQLSPSFSWMSTDDNLINGNGTNLGLKLGMLSEYYFRENYAIVSGINFSFNQGGTLRHEQGGNLWSKSELSNLALMELPDGVNLQYHIQYLEIPFGLKMRTREFGYLRYFAEIPTFTLGFKLQARGDVKGTANLDTERENITEDVNLFNLTWGFGGGIHYTLSDNTAIVGGIIYRQGFADVTDDGAIRLDGSPENSKAVIRSITIRLGLLF